MPLNIVGAPGHELRRFDSDGAFAGWLAGINYGTVPEKIFWTSDAKERLATIGCHPVDTYAPRKHNVEPIWNLNSGIQR